MKVYSQLFFSSLILLLAMPTFATPRIDLDIIDVKCYVEFVGGGTGISRWAITPKRLEGLAEEIIGMDIATAGKDKRKVYKVEECILLEDEFESKEAKRLNKSMDY